MTKEKIKNIFGTILLCCVMCVTLLGIATEISDAILLTSTAQETTMEVTLVNSYIEQVGNYTEWNFIAEVVDENYTRLKIQINKDNYEKIHSGEINYGEKCIISGNYSYECNEFYGDVAICTTRMY